MAAGSTLMKNGYAAKTNERSIVKITNTRPSLLNKKSLPEFVAVTKQTMNSQPKVAALAILNTKPAGLRPKINVAIHQGMPIILSTNKAIA